jgi:hypothetical protein
MNIPASLTLAAALAAAAPCALADTIYKCVEAGGKVAFSSLPCAGQATQAKQLSVPAPEADEVSAARLYQERARLRMADHHFRMRQGMRDADYASARSQTRIANVPAPKAAQAGKQNAAAAERAEAARLNAARIGNCSMRRPEANCL